MLRKVSLLPNLNKTNNNCGGRQIESSQYASLGEYTDFETNHVVTFNDGVDLRLFAMAPD